MPAAITGLWAAATTPTDAAGTIDHGALARHADRLLRGGCDGLVLFGSSGEGPSLSMAERLAAAEAVLACGHRADGLALGTGCPAIPDTVTLTKGHARASASRALCCCRRSISPVFRPRESRTPSPPCSTPSRIPG